MKTGSKIAAFTAVAATTLARARLSPAWRQVLACFMMLAAVGMIASTYSIVAVPLDREYGPSRAVLMLSMTVLAGVCAILSPFLGHLMDKVAMRWLVMLGGICLGSGYAALSLTSQFWHVLLIYGTLIAVANVLLGPVAMTVLLSRWFTERRGQSIGFAIAGISAGGIAFPFIIQGLLDAFDWRTAMKLLGILLACWIAAAALLVKDRPARDPEIAKASSNLLSPNSGTVQDIDISTMQILKDPAFWLLAGTVAIATAGMKGMVTNLVPMAIDNGIDASRASRLISIFAASSFIAKMSFAVLADRVGPRILMSFSLGGVAMGLICLTQGQAGFAVIALGVSLAGLFGGLMIPMESYLAPRIFGTRIVGRAMGLLSGVVLIAMLCTPPLFGLIFDLTGSYEAIFWTFGALGLAAILWVPFLRLHPRDQSTG